MLVLLPAATPPATGDPAQVISSAMARSSKLCSVQGPEYTPQRPATRSAACARLTRGAAVVGGGWWVAGGTGGAGGGRVAQAAR